jgi:vesicle coat complex subunit
MVAIVWLLPQLAEIIKRDVEQLANIAIDDRVLTTRFANITR